MGVPKFFRYISERYPCLSETVKEYQIPEFDNLYLDMNGIIHTCSHPDDGDAHFRITEEKIFQDIFHYIEVLFRMIKPRRLFFMAVDGVAPRAKMNQQRGRRFRTAKEVQVLEAKATERGEVLPKEARFDSNCITPGTVFMARLHEQLKYFIVNKISNDKLWQGCKIILSGHETPGEGEHKIMDYIRYMRSQPCYDPNTRHCLYGLDADLIVLGLCTHEPHFSLLREEVKYGIKSTKRKNIPEQITFMLLHLSLMREYLELEFSHLKDSLTFEYDMEKIIDDWVLMGFLVGNDFIPHLPNMHIANGALSILYNAYMRVLPKLGGYINEAGLLNLQRFDAFMEELGNIDIDNFSEKYADLKWFESKTGRRFNEKTGEKENLRKLEVWEPDDGAVGDKPLEPTSSNNSDLAALIKATDDMLLDSPVVEKTIPLEDLENIVELDVLEPEGDDEDTSDTEKDNLFSAEFLQHKTDYYMNKLDYEHVTPEVLRAQATEYVRAIQWNLHYYYNGVCSWGWFYPHHYAPYISDIKGFANLKLDFELGKPFKPYEQLLAVLPVASKNLLPNPYQDLMVNDNSIIKNYYPEDFKTDLNGKRQEWEAVVLIPFIDEDLLLEAMSACNNLLTEEEKNRNTHRPMLEYQYTNQNLGEYESPEYFPTIKVSHACIKHVTIEEIRLPEEKLIKGAYPGAKFDVYYPGFPTLKHLKYKGVLQKAKVKVFEQPSRGENMILQIINEYEPLLNDEDDPLTTDSIASDLLGTIVHVGWPHLVEASVVSVSDKGYHYHSAGEKGQYNVEENKGNILTNWKLQKEGMEEYYKNRLGVDVGISQVLVHVKVMVGRKYLFTNQGKFSLEKEWATVQSTYPLQTVVRDIAVYESNFEACNNIDVIFPKNSYCFMLAQPGYGCIAQVIESTETMQQEGRIKISLTKKDEPDLSSAMDLENDIKIRYMNVHVAATKLAISKYLFSRITGTIFITPGSSRNMEAEDVAKVNIGLNLKFNKKNEEIPGYSRKEGTLWYYSDKAVKLVGDYMEKFPQVFGYLNYNSGNDIFFEDEMFPDGNAKEVLHEISAWIKQQPFSSVERQVCGSLTLDPDTVQDIEKIVDQYNADNSQTKQLIIKVKPRLLYKSDLQFGNLMPDPAATFLLFDRIVNVREGFTVPLGYKATIIGIHKPSTAKEIETTYDVVFDQEFAGGLALNCSSNRGYRMPRAAIINISYGQRIMEQKTGKPGVNGTASQGTHSNYKGLPLSYAAKQGNYPSHFQPQPAAFSSWSQGCNYPVRTPLPPMQNFNQQYSNFNFRPDNAQHNSNFFPNYNNRGPNSFVPYKPNLFMPPTPPHIRPTLPVHIPNNAKESPHSYKKTWERKNEPGQLNFVPSQTERTNANQSEPTRIQAPPPFKSQQINVSNAQDSESNSNMLKKLLKINESVTEAGTSVTKTQANVINKPTGNSILPSVEDFFAKIRSKDHQQPQSSRSQPNLLKQQPQLAKPSEQRSSTYSTALLAKEFQTQNFGCPQFQYIETNDQFVAKLLMPNGSVLIGLPGKTSEEAAENVAEKALKYLKPTRSDAKVVSKPPLDAVPEPPKLWREQSRSSPQKTWSNTRGPPQRFENRKKDNVDNSKNVNYDNRRVSNPSQMSIESTPREKQKTVESSQFVPLQAVRNKQKTSSTSISEPSVKGNTQRKNPQGQSKKSDAAQGAQRENQASDAHGSNKPRRERKMRIAANFSTTMNS